jgi:hypothetical protein
MSSKHTISDPNEVPYLENARKNLINNPDINGLYNYEGNDFTDSLIEHIEKQQLIFNHCCPVKIRSRK